MARIPPVDPSDPSTDARTAGILRDYQEERGGDAPLNVMATVAHNPAAVAGLRALAHTLLTESVLTAAERELAYLTASVANDCHY